MIGAWRSLGSVSSPSIGWFVLVASLAVTIVWLAVTAESTLLEIRVAADRASLQVARAIDRPAPPPPFEVIDRSPPGQAAAPVAPQPESAAPSAQHSETDGEEDRPPIVEEGELPPLTRPGQPTGEPPSQAALPAPSSPGTPIEIGAPARPAVEIDEGQFTQIASAAPPPPPPDLIEVTDIGPLPRIAPDGREPWQAYARRVAATDGRSRIAIVITDLGLSSFATETAIQRLPGAVTLAFSPYAPELDVWLPQARAAGHEALMMLPMEPETYPQDDPGPLTLLTSLGPDRNRERLNHVLSRGIGYVGVVSTMGSRFTATPDSLEPMLAALAQRGLLVLDSRTTSQSTVSRLAASVGMPWAVSDRFIDSVASRDAIDLKLRELEEIALEDGNAIGVGLPFPVTLERLHAWIPSLEERGIVLAPISAVVERQEPS